MVHVLAYNFHFDILFYQDKLMKKGMVILREAVKRETGSTTYKLTWHHNKMLRGYSDDNMYIRSFVTT